MERACRFNFGRSVKAAIERLGVIHTEVDLILASGRSVDFSYRVADGDRISVCSLCETLDVTNLVWLRGRLCMAHGLCSMQTWENLPAGCAG
jgi:hypothetical protein